jgi:small subunit ribosomal protein S16
VIHPELYFGCYFVKLAKYMVKIRLSRTGPKKKPFYRIVAMDEKRKNKGVFLEVLGYWLPNNQEIKIDKERLKFWVQKGAQTTSAVEKLL